MSDHISVVVLTKLFWVFPDQRLQGIGKVAIETHCEHIIERGGLVDFIEPMKDDIGFWNKCGYKDDESDYLKRDLLDYPISTIVLNGNLPKNNIEALLKKSPLFDRVESRCGGFITLNDRLTYITVKSPRVWKLYNATLRHVTVLRGLLAQIGVNVHCTNICF